MYVLANKEDTTKFEFQDLIIIPDTIEGAGWSNISTLHSQDLGNDAVLQGFSNANSASLEIPDTPSTVTPDQGEVVPTDVGAGETDGDQNPETLSPDQRQEGVVSQEEESTVSDAPQVEGQEETNEEHVPDVPIESPVVDAPVSFNSFFDFSYDGFQNLFTEKSVGSFVSIAQATSSTAYDVDNIDMADQELVQHIDEIADPESQPSEESITTTPDAPEQAVVTGESSTEQVIPQQNPVVGEVVRETINPYIAKYHCALLEDCGVPVLEFSGFSVPSFDGATTIESAQIRLSFGAREAEDAENIGEVRLMYTFDAKTWVDAGSLYIEDEVTNAANGGHFLFALPDTIDDDALASLRVRVVYDGDYHDVDTLFIDSLWVELSAVSFYESEDGELLSDEIEYERELLLPTYNDLLVPQADFLADDLPVFQFKYRSQENVFERFFEYLFSSTEEYAVIRTTLNHTLSGEVEVPSKVEYNDNGTWTLSFLEYPQKMHPGKYVLTMDIEEDGHTYTDQFEFYWGVLAINSTKSMYHKSEPVSLHMAALTETGDTICHAHLALTVTSPSHTVYDVPVSEGGDCGPNNVTDVPDYLAQFTNTDEIGEYHISLSHYNKEGQEVHHTKDTFEVREYIPFDIERTAPTRIYPPAPYTVSLHIKANREFNGVISEPLPRGFEIVDSGGGSLATFGDANYLTWNATLQEGDELTLTYKFDAPDVSPYLYLLGPLDMDGFKELRAWQIASDALSGVAWLTGTQSENGTNLNSIPYRMLWSTSTIDTYYYRHSTTSQSERVTLRRSGDYYFAVTLPQQRADANATFTRIGIEVRINGVAVPQGLGRSGWIRGANNHTESSSHASFLLTNLQPDDYVEVYVQDLTSVGADTVNVTGQASMYIEYIPTSNNVFAGTATSTVASTSLNVASSSPLTWTETRQDAGFTHSDALNPENIIINNPGTYMVQVSVPLETNRSSSVAMNVLGRVLLNGAQVPGGVFSQGLAYGNAVGGSNDFYSSIHWSGIVTSTTTNQVLTITTEQEASAGTTTVPTGFVGSIFIKEIPSDDTIVLNGRNLASTTNWSVTTAQKLLWDAHPVYDSVTFTHATTSSSTMGDIVVNESGDYLLSYNDALTSANTYVNTRIAIQVDGVPISGAQTKSQIIRNAGNHNNSSGALVYLLKGLTAGQVVRVMVDEEASTGGTTNDVTDAVLMLWKKAELNLEPQAITFYDTPFDSIRYSSTTPKFEFSSIDPDGTSDMVYQISWSTSTSFGASTTRTTGVDTGFTNTASSSDTSPFVEGNRIRYQVQAGETFAFDTVYYWRVRAQDVTGSGNYGDWSSIQSMTITSGIETPDWYQTVDGQFNTNTLVGAQSNGNGSVEVTVDDNTEVLFAYAETTNTTLQYRLWDGSAWGIERDALDVGGVINWVVTDAAPTRDEYIAGTLDANNDINFQVYTAGSSTPWGNLYELTTTASNASRRGLAVAYETSSGDALAIGCDGDADPFYRIWNGSAWSATGTVDMNSVNNCEMLTLASDPTSDEIILVARDTGAQYEAQVWDGNTWLPGSSQILGSMQAGDETKEGLSVVYEASGNQAIVATTNGSGNNFLWNSWNGLTWGSNTTFTLQNDFENGRLVADEGTDRVALCYINDSNYIGAVIWDGDAWGSNRNLIITGNDDRGRAVDCEFETLAGRDGNIIAPYSDTGVDGDYHGVYTSAWATSTGSDINDSFWVQTVRTGDGLILAMHFDDETDDIDFTYWNGTSWSTPHETLEDTPASTATPNYETGMMAARRFVSETGTVFSTPIRHSAQSNEPTWGDIYFSTTETFGTSATLQVYYSSTTTCDTPISDGVLPGNATGFNASQSPINISGISTTTFNEICLKATLVQNSGTSPTLDSWRVTWERSPIVSQNSFRWYVNGSFFTPTDPWPLGVSDLAEFTPLSSSEPIDLGEEIRLRMSLNVTNVNLSTSTKEFKLQYAPGASCSASSAWVDVGSSGSTTALWRGYENAIVGSDWYSGNWGRRVKIIVDSDLVVGSITDYPVYVNLADLPSGFFSAVQPDGDDIRVTGSNGITELPFELVSISTTTLTGELHFKANLSSTTDSEFFIYYGNATATPYGATATYGSENVWTNNFEAVYHFKENPGGSAPQMYDSTGNGHNATTDLMDATNATSGRMGNGIDANGTNESVIAPGFTGLGTVNTAYGMGIWFKPDTGETDGNIIGMSINSPPNNWRLPPLALNGGFLQAISWTGAQVTAIGTTSVTQNSWHQGYTTWSASGGLKAYLDGSLARTVTQATYTASGGSNYLHIAGDVAGGAGDEGHFDGKVDELRVYTTSIAANWIATEFNNISNATGFYDISNEELISDGREIPLTRLTASDVAETYEEQNPTFSNVRAISADMDGEWDFVLQNNNASSSTQYCFRMVYSDGELLDEYLYYPELITNAPPLTPVLSLPFDNEKVASATPYFEFVANDDAEDDITYNIQIDTDYTFGGTPYVDQNSEAHGARFSNLSVSSDKDPFTSGQTIRYIPTTAMATGTTYWWRVRAKDPGGANTYGAWSEPYSFTFDPTVTVTTWFQTTDDQFSTDILEDATPNDSGNDVRITATYNYATVTTASIDFDDGHPSRGNAWSSLQFTDQNDVKYSLEYLSGSVWSLIPDADLPGNSSGYTSGTISLIGLDTDVYNEIRIRAVLSDVSGEPRLQDWTISWGNRIDAPTLLSPFDNAKVATTTPVLTFVTTDPNGNALEYEFSFSTSSTFVASTTYLSSTSGFADLVTPASSSPFASGHTISYTIQSGDELTSSSTYWWRVRARDTVFSPWSDPHSFTVDESIVVSTWYQTTGEQFNTNELNDTQGNSVLEQAEINTTLREAMVAYGEGSVQSPKYRLWNGSAWSEELPAESVGAQIDNVALVSSPTRNEYALATLGTDGDTNIQIYNGDGESWGLPHEISQTSADTNMRGFDVAYETDSGDLLTVACNGTEAVFDVWDGDSWIGTSTLPLSNTNSCLWVKLVSDPDSTSDEIILVTRSSNASTTDYEVQVWDGSAWGDQLQFGDMDENAHEGIAVEYEESGNQAVVVVSNWTNPNFLYSTWNGSSWVATSSATGTVTLGNDFEWGTLSRDEGSDRLALCYIDENNDMGLVIWSGSSWGAFNEFETLGNAKQGRPVSCQFETVGSRDGYIMIPYSDDGAGGAGDGGKYRYYATSSISSEIDLGTIEDSYNVITSRASDGTILTLFLDDVADDYVFTAWDGSNWSTQEILDTNPSVTGTPFNESIALASRKFPAFTSGSLRSTIIDYDDGLGPRWERVLFNDTGSITYRVYYKTSTTTLLVPEEYLPGNSVGFTTSPIDLSLLNKVIHNQLLLDAQFECVLDDCPTLPDWSVEWAEGIDISGHAYAYNGTTTVTSGSVSVAVNGVLQAGKTGSILGDGSWTIENVTAFEGDEVLVFIDGVVADADEALAAATYDGIGDMTGLELSKRHLTIGSNDTGTTTHAGLSGYDVIDNENIFMSLSGNDLTLCADSGCADAQLVVKSNAIYQPGTGADAVVHDFFNYGKYIPNGNTLRVSGSWYDYGSTTIGTSTLIFTATTSTEAVTTASSTYSFYNVTFGETTGSAMWNINKPLDVNGTLAVDYGTLARSTSSITIAQNLRIGNGGVLTGLGTTTFDGSGSYTWTDTSASSSNIGYAVIDGEILTVTLSGNTKAQSVTIGNDDTLNASSGGYTLSVLGSWTNNNSFVPLNGTVIFIGTTTETIRTGASSFNNLTFNATGTWYFASSTLTLTGNLTIATGTVILPSGTTTIGGSILNTGGTFAHNNGVVIMNSTSPGRTITLGGTSFLNALYNIRFTGSGSWTFSEAYATTSNDMYIQSGSVTFPTGSLTIGGDLVTTGSGSFTHAGGEVIFLVRGSDTITTNGSSFNNVRTRGVTGASWLNSAWSYRLPITISASKVASTTTGFPVYVKLSDLSSSFFTNVKSNGGDIRITKSDGVTEVPFELVSINTGASTGELYFKGDISSSTNTTFYVYYKNASASGYASTSTYGRNNVWTNGYDAVLHMEENPGGTAPQMTDSTSGGRSGTTFTMTSGDQVAGQFGNSVNHDGSATDRVRAGNFANLGTANKPYAISVWFNADTGETSGNLLHVSSGSDGSGWCLPMLAINSSLVQAISWTGGQVTALGTTAITQNSWNQTYATWNATSGLQVYLNGAREKTTTQAVFTASGGSNYIHTGFNYGSCSGNTGTFDGKIDEVRIYNEHKPASWIQTEYNNQASTTSFYTIGGQEEPRVRTFSDTNTTILGNYTAETGSDVVFPTGVLSIGGSFDNDAVFSANGGTVRFNSTAGNETVSAGTSTFATLDFNSASGYFTLLESATATAVTLTQAQQFTATSGITLTATSSFTNQMAAGSTTWTGATLKLAGNTAMSLNAKSHGGDTYGILMSTDGTRVSMWNSSADTYTTLATSSIYSQDHAGFDGDLYIFGQYARTSGTEHWSYGTDFDGTSLSTSTSRQVDVRFASGTTAVFGTSTLSIIGTSTATTTVANQGVGTYVVSVLRGTTTASFYSFANLGPSGLVLASSTKVLGLSDGAFTLGVASGTAITVSSTTINNATSSLQISRVNFATTTAITGRNVTQNDGNPSLFWWFRDSTGNISGEAFDNDTGNPGSIRWDDSALTVTISGTVYSDDGVTTMSSPTCDGTTPNVTVIVNPGTATSTWCASSNGAYSINVPVVGDVTLTTYLNTNGGQKGVIVTKTPTGNITNHHIYANRVITKHQDVLPLTIADMARVDSTDDADIPFTAATGTIHTLVLPFNTELHIASSTTFAPGGDITINGNASGTSQDGSVHIDDNATLTGSATSTYTIGGSFTMDAGATFTPASTTVIMNATTTGKTITTTSGQEISFNNLQFTGVGGGWNVNGNIRALGNITVATGTVTGTSNITLPHGSMSGNGTVSLGLGTTTIEQTNTLGGTTGWTFANLVLGNAVSAGTTTLASNATTTVLGKLTISTAHVLDAGGSLWNLAGSGNVFVENGSYREATSTLRYSGTGSTNILGTTYYDLDLKALGGSPTYTATGIGIAVTRNLTIGGATTTTVTFDTADPVLDVNGNVRIDSVGTFVGSASATTSIGGNWDNNGVFTGSGGRITFDGSGTTNISAGISWFSNVTIDGTGTFTVLQHATATGAFALTSAGSFTVSNGQSLAIGGVFTRGVSGGVTTWTGSTLYLYGSNNYTLNASSSSDTYEKLSIGSGAQIRMWNSDASVYDVHASGSLYSQDHADQLGDLYIYGAYTKTTGTDYWSYARDFDGSTLSSPRTADVYFASGASATFTGGGLSVVGTSTGTTTVQNQGSGTYSLRIGGTASTTWNYYKLRNMDTAGLTFSGTPNVVSLSYGDFEVSQNNGTAITVGGTALQVRTFVNTYFETSGASPAYNVTATGTTVNSWKFTGHSGSIAGEAYDIDPGANGGDPGYIVWDNSSTSISVSGVVYSGEGVGISTACDGSDTLRLVVGGATQYTTSCDGDGLGGGTGAYTFPNVSFNIGDSFIVYIDGQAEKAATVSEDTFSTISNFDLYENRVIVRHEGVDSLSIDDMHTWSSADDGDVPFTTVNGSPDILTLPANYKLIVWNEKTFEPNGNVTVSGGGGGSSYDGTLELYTNAVFDATGSETHTIGGSMVSNSGASLDAETSTFIFTTSGASRTIDTNEDTFYNLTVNGSGSWTVSDSLLTIGNDLTITQGSLTLPTGTTTVAGSFLNTGGSFSQNGGSMYFTGTGAESVRTGNSPFGTTTFDGSGSWSYLSTNSTSTGNFSILQGSVSASSGTLAVSGDFINNGTFTHNNGTLRLYGSSNSGFLTLHGSDLGSTTIAGTGTYTMTDTNVALMGTLSLTSGGLTLATGTVSIAGSLLNTGGSFNHSSGTILFNSSDTGERVNPGSSLFHNVTFASAGGGWNITHNATTTGNFSLTSATSFTQSSSTRLMVRGVFTNYVGGVATDWTGSTLVINSGTGYTINTKSSGGDVYNTILIGSSTALRAWDSAGTVTLSDTASSFYSQDHAGVTGSLYIFGNYVRSTGMDYWSYATDFDGIPLGLSPRQVYVYHAQGASTTLTGGTLNIIGANGTSTTISNQGSGTYGLNISGGTLNAQHYAIRNIGAQGLAISGTTTITSLDNGDFELAVASGTLMRISSTTLNYNASMVISGLRFATTSAITGKNVTLVGTTSSSWSFVSHQGNFDGEYFDSDGGDNCGSLRWEDSTCLLTEQVAYRWRSDDGGEGVPDSEWYDLNWTKRKRVTITNHDGIDYTNAVVKVVLTHDGDMQSDFDDIRFTSSDGITPINFVREKYSISSQATFWVKVPQLDASTDTEIYAYYGYGAATYAGVGTTTFIAYEDFENSPLSQYGGDTTLFAQSATFGYQGSYGLGVTDTGGRTTDGIYRIGATVSQGETIRFMQYIDTSSGSGDETCTLFGVQDPGSGNQNYGVCLEQFGVDRVSLVKNAYDNDSNATILATSTVTYVTGWHEVEIDWGDDDSIAVSVYRNGTLIATTSATDNTSPYTSGGIGFTFWFQNGGWDLYSSRPLITTEPTTVIGYEQVSGGATWLASRNTSAVGLVAGDVARIRFAIENTGITVTDAYQLEFASKGVAPSCESVSASAFVPVPTQASCSSSSSSICMQSSSEVTNTEPTTDVLGGDGTFTPGSVVVSPSNTGTSMSLAASTFTEMEYAIILTNYVSDQSYCFRVSDNGTDIDSYARVAELQLLFEPNITTVSLNGGVQDIILLPGVTTTIYATGTVSDLNGYTDLDINRATTTMYRSGVTEACTADNNNCYISAGPSKCSFSECSDVTDSCLITCSADFYYHADPTDDFSPYDGETWRALLSVSDMGGSVATGSSPSIDLQTTKAISVNTNIDYPPLETNANSEGINPTTTVTNIGNISLDVGLEGSDLTDGGSSYIGAQYQKFATSSFTYGGCGVTVCTELSSTTVKNLKLDLAKPVSTTPVISDEIFWGIAIPVGVAGRAHYGTNIMYAILDVP